MKKLFSHADVKLITAIACLFLMSGACSAPKHEGFAIYLTKGDVPPAQMEALSHIDIAEQPVFATDDIISYNAGTHEITLTEDAYKRVCSLEVPVRGRSFVVCVDRNPIYRGAFWNPVSSMSFNGVTIMKRLGSGDSKAIKLELGYPSPSFYGGEDPRDSTEVLAALQRAGKLTDMP